MNERRKRLLIELEKIIGNEFYTANIQNWGPGGVFEGEGRAFRYPVILRDREGKTVKTWNVDGALPAETVITSMYKFEANELSVMRALDLEVTHLERNYGLDLSKARKESFKPADAPYLENHRGHLMILEQAVRGKPPVRTALAIDYA